ncbi:MAG: CotH kinase family protein [Ruminococcus sp.]|nr:CotH kinase family protein [Ruminococcus sp.]
MKLKLLTTLLAAGAISVTASSSISSAIDGSGALGDINKDGKVNSIDIAIMKSEELYSPVTDNSDINQTGTRTKADIRYLTGFVHGMYKFTDKEELVINEILADNSTVTSDKLDYIELYNGTNSDINLDGYGLSDNPDKPAKIVLDGKVIPAHSYLCISLDDLTMGFAFSKNGERAVLTDPNGKLIDKVIFPALDENISYSRYKNGSDIFKATTPTLGKSNDDGTIVNNYSMGGNIDFAVPGGYYPNEMQVSLKYEPGHYVYYSTDGSNPVTGSPYIKKTNNSFGNWGGWGGQQDNGLQNQMFGSNPMKRYTEPVTVKNEQYGIVRYASISGQAVTKSENGVANSVTRGTVIRAISYDPEENNYSEDYSHTYFVGVNLQEKYPGAVVISLTTDPENLFDYEKGIFMLGKTYYDDPANQSREVWEGMTANFMNRGIEWEREVHMELFEPDGTVGFSSDMGIRVTGNASRNFSQKSVKFHMRGDYGQKSLLYDLLPGTVKMSDGVTPVKDFNSFTLRQGANDSDYAKLRDPFIQRMSSELGFDTQGYRPAVMFIDGEYWGVYSIRQDYSDDYVNSHYDVPKDDVIIQKNGYQIDEGEENDIQLWYSFTDYVKNNDMSNDDNYRKACEMVDIDDFISYYAAEIYVNNWDWPKNNQRFWRSKTIDPSNPYMDGKWRPMMFDTEYSLNLYDGMDTSSRTDNLRIILSQGNARYDEVLAGFMRNSEFKSKFRDKLLEVTEMFSSKGLTVLDEMAGQYGPLMTEQKQRFRVDWNDFNTEVNKIRSFINERGNYITQMLNNNGLS